MDITAILGYGAIGLSFLLAGLAYRLLTQEQQREPPREAIIRSVYVFMAFCLLLLIASIVAKLNDSSNESVAQECVKLKKDNADLQKQLGDLTTKFASQGELLAKYKQRQKDYAQNFEEVIETVRSLTAFVPAGTKKPIFDELNKIKPHSVE